jgi:hypothetical protein
MGERSLLDWLGLPENFGYALLIVGLALLLAPYLRGGDFGIVKVPDFEPGVRSALRVVGPIVMLIAVIVHVDLLPSAGEREARGNGGPSSASDGGTVEPLPLPPQHQRVLARWGSGCLYPATSLGSDGDAVEVYFAFAREDRVKVQDVFDLPALPPTGLAPGDRVFAALSERDAWAPGEVREIRDGRALVELEKVDCIRDYAREYVWADLDGQKIFIVEGSK